MLRAHMNPIWSRITDNTLAEPQLRLLDAYLDRLIEKNKVLNLTRITDRTEAEVKHVADALTLLPFLPPPPHKNVTVADVGTGGGIPGVILAIARPDIRVTLIDSTRKKLDAVKEICDAIGVNNVDTLHTRIESADRKFDIITARAVAEMETLLGWCEGLMKRSSVLLAMKGPRVDEEMTRVSPRTRKRWRMETHEVDAPELAGHRIVAARLA
jgi:16S rRNA (guanine527-N7)-methyltransferase